MKNRNLRNNYISDKWTCPQVSKIIQNELWLSLRFGNKYIIEVRNLVYKTKDLPVFYNFYTTNGKESKWIIKNVFIKRKVNK